MGESYQSRRPAIPGHGQGHCRRQALPRTVPVRYDDLVSVRAIPPCGAPHLVQHQRGPLDRILYPQRTRGLVSPGLLEQHEASGGLVPRPCAEVRRTPARRG